MMAIIPDDDLSPSQSQIHYQTHKNVQPQQSQQQSQQQSEQIQPQSQPRMLRIGPYRLGKTLGIGSFCKVKLATHEPTGIRVAIKILNRRKLKKQDMGDKFRTEIHILRMFQHPHIIRLYEVIDTPTDIFTVMEYVPGGELFDYIVSKGRLDEREARTLFQQIVSGVEYCTVNMVVHRDLKPENLLLDVDNRIKIADFGLSSRLRDGQFLKTSCGSPNYAAPEVISGNLYCGPEVDVWSCGVILFALLCGSLPFDDENIRSLFRKIKNGIYTIPPHVPPGARDLIQQMLVVDPVKRITIAQVMQHPWYRTNLPAYLAVSAEQQIERENVIDEQIVAKIVTMSYTTDAIYKALNMGVELTTSRSMANLVDARKIAVIYNLLKDQKRRTEQKDDEISELISVRDSGYDTGVVEMDESTFSLATLSTRKQLISLQQHKQSISDALSAAYRNPSTAAAIPVPSHGVLPAAGRWYLGCALRDEPQLVMNALYITLKKLNFEWKVLSLYRVKARYPAGLVDRVGRTVSSSEVVKVNIQLYRLPSPLPSNQLFSESNNSSNDGSVSIAAGASGFEGSLFPGDANVTHCVDMHKLFGQMFLFLYLANSIFTSLREVLPQ